MSTQKSPYIELTRQDMLNRRDELERTYGTLEELLDKKHRGEPLSIDEDDALWNLRAYHWAETGEMLN